MEFQSRNCQPVPGDRPFLRYQYSGCIQCSHRKGEAPHSTGEHFSCYLHWVGPDAGAQWEQGRARAGEPARWLSWRGSGWETGGAADPGSGRVCVCWLGASEWMQAGAFVERQLELVRSPGRFASEFLR